MASEQHDTVFPEEDMDDDDDESQFDLEEEEEEDDDDVLVDDEENEPSPSTSSALAVTIAVPGSTISNGDKPPISTATATRIIAAAAGDSDSKRQLVELQIEEKKPLVDDSRRLFQRLWTDEDEIELLQGFLDYTSHRGSSHHNDTALFYDQIKSKLQLDFNKNQLVEKIRRLKKKYRNVLNKINSGKEFSFKTAHDQATFEISRKIWSNIGQTSFTVEDNALDEDEIPNLNPNPNINLNFTHSTPKYEVVMLGNSAEKKSTPSRKRSRPRSAPVRAPMIRPDEKRESNDGSALDKDHNCISNATATVTATLANNNNDNNCNSVHSVPGLIEETVRSCLSPLLKELVGGAMGGRGFGGFSLNPMSMPTVMPMPLSNMSFLGLGNGEVVDDKWRKQQILELEVYSKRLELVQDQIKVALEELRSVGGG